MYADSLLFFSLFFVFVSELLSFVFAGLIVEGKGETSARPVK